MIIYIYICVPFVIWFDEKKSCWYHGTNLVNHIAKLWHDNFLENTMKLQIVLANN